MPVTSEFQKRNSDVTGIKIKKMKKIFILFFLLALSVSALAIPPSDILIEYDADTKILHMEVKHISTNIRDHYIRRLIVYKNDIEVSKFTYAKQTSATALTQDLAVEAVPGDVIRVKAICNESGPEEKTFIVP